ncbi:hypothetical protein [Novosphingobium sp. TCA1]|uniref:hypothetical protein n=1 Tax=Novosphingobium sp. TCA1 TaxID=2682474 RepID=UPI001308B7B7|nr:hypothetical protein [Novosphingobium sp. TCA1]GFE74398.1 hypothetical protein NTCA1_20470 [Novosphingobium sp. TCA1]
MSDLLPAGFAALEPFVAQWALAGSAARAVRRGTSSREEREAFYAAGRDLLDAALDHLDRRGLDAFDAADERLMNLLLSLAHVSLAVELQKDAEPVHADFRRFMRITRTPAGA